MSFNLRRPFAQYRDSGVANILAFIEIIVLFYYAQWVTTSGGADSLAVTVASFYRALLVIPAVIIMGDLLYGFTNARRSRQFPVSLGFGSGWRALWGIVGAFVAFFLLRFAGGLSFMSTSLAITNTPTMFWFLVVVGPRSEETFRNVLTPTLISAFEHVLAALRGGRRSVGDNLVAGLVVIFLLMSPLFAVFHWYTYMEQGGAGGNTSLLLVGAYVYSIIFTLGMYFFRTDEFSKWLHMLHNFAVYRATLGWPNLPAWQVAGVMVFLFVLLVYFLSVFFTNMRRLGAGGFKF